MATIGTTTGRRIPYGSGGKASGGRRGGSSGGGSSSGGGRAKARTSVDPLYTGRSQSAPGAGATAAAAAAAVRKPARAAAMPGDRVVWVCAVVMLMYVGLAGRLTYLQAFQHEEFVRRAEALRDKTITLPAKRGVLLDRAGTVLVRNEPAWHIALDPNDWFVNPNPKIGDTSVERQERAVSGLAALLPDVDVRGIVAEKGLIKTQGGRGRYRTIDIARQVPDSVGQTIKKANLIGVAVLPATRRVAINGQLAPHIVGFTGRDGEGLDGLESGLDEYLSGRSGILAAEFDTKGRPIPGTIRAEQPALAGRDVVLTLDAQLQHITQSALIKVYQQSQAEAATAIVLDPKTGDILALANYPAYNVNRRGETPVAARTNRAVTAPFEPGSTLKVVTVAAALEEKKVRPTTHFYCAGAKRIGRRTIHCAHNAHRDENLLEVIQNSCNIATAECAYLLGKRNLYEYNKRFGFGQSTDSGLPGESRGILAPPEKWSEIQFANVAFGQGISVTPLQLAAAYAAFANDGVYMPPRIVRGERDGETQKLIPAPAREGRRILSSETARDMRRMLQAVVDDGTGNLAQLDGYTAGGKTGTAQIAEGGRYVRKFVSSFVGIAPMSDPQFVILVSVTAPKGAYYGGVVAGPVFKEIAEKALIARRIPHDRPTDRDEAEAKKKGRKASKKVKPLSAFAE